jgi:hypothetical protein
MARTPSETGSVVPIREAGLPAMTVVELAVIIALLRLGPSSIGAVAPVLAQWFAVAARPEDLSASVRRMLGQGWLAEGSDGCLRPAPAALAPTQLLYAGFIRMLGDGLEPAQALEQLSLSYDPSSGERP